jgi:hypothetical protein
VNRTGRVTFSIVEAGNDSRALPKFDATAELWRDNAGVVVCARGAACGDVAWMEVPGVATFRFDRSDRSVEAIATVGVDRDLVYDTYYRAALPLALQFFGFEVLHASAVRTSAGVVAFCAVSETGKSTTVGALSRRGYTLWADDAVTFQINDGDLGAHALAVPFRLRLHPMSASAIGDAETAHRWPKPRPIELEAAPLAALCVLRREAGGLRAAEINGLSRIDSVTALLPHAYCFTMDDPNRKRLMMRRYIDLAERVPTFAVTIASGLEKLPDVLNEIEQSIPAFNPTHKLSRISHEGREM